MAQTGILASGENHSHYGHVRQVASVKAESGTARPYGEARVSSARRTIAACADSFRGAFTVEELTYSVHESAEGGAPATVYRAVAAMEEAGYLERVGERQGSALYTRCGHADHHHHIVCDRCGTTAPARCPVGPELLEPADIAGFTLTRHEVTLYGLCPDCAAKDGA